VSWKTIGHKFQCDWRDGLVAFAAPPEQSILMSYAGIGRILISARPWQLLHKWGPRHKSQLDICCSTSTCGWLYRNTSTAEYVRNRVKAARIEAFFQTHASHTLIPSKKQQRCVVL
jgi:hypothetical protein